MPLDAATRIAELEKAIGAKRTLRDTTLGQQTANQTAADQLATDLTAAGVTAETLDEQYRQAQEDRDSQIIAGEAALNPPAVPQEA
jgi:hypothetical protein